jgi:hypothetical protein
LEEVFLKLTNEKDTIEDTIKVLKNALG